MKAFDSTIFRLPLPDKHRFPMAKYSRLAARIREELPEIELLEAPRARRHQLARVHCPNYIQKVFDGTMTKAAVRRIGFPWSDALVERSRRSVGATIAAAMCAKDDLIAVNLAGGTHHAHRDFGSGFCVFNDVAVATRHLQEEGVSRIAILDFDVHQGDGTATLFEDDPEVLTISLHCEQNFPFRKASSDYDCGLAVGAGDQEYLTEVERALVIAQEFKPDAVFYIAGADPFIEDSLGQLNVTNEGLRQRDALLFSTFTQQKIPIAVSMGGGYCKDIDRIVELHFQTVRLALKYTSSFEGIN